MQKFGWKRKIGADVSKSASSAFENESKDDTDASIENGEVDWLTLAPVKKFVIGLEDKTAKANRLIQEGTVLASSERYWEAIKKWDEAVQYTPGDEKIYEMKAQALMELCEVYPAVQMAKKAVELAPTWWVAHQTLGRAYLGMGEVKMAVQSFSRGVHLNPGDRELWEEDLLWAQSLLEKRKLLEREKLNTADNRAKITELDPDSDAADGDNVGRGGVGGAETRIDLYNHGDRTSGNVSESVNLGKMPSNYVQMRDYMPP